MDEAWFWIIAIVIVVAIIVLIAIIVESTRPEVQVNVIEPGRTLPAPRISQRHESCIDAVCGAGLVCTQIGNDRRCLSVLDQTCLIDQDCASGFCQIKMTGQGGVCRNPTPIPPSPMPGTGTQIYCRHGDNWITRTTLSIPAGLTFTRITSSNGRLLGISRQTNQVFIWNGSFWQDISSTFTAPGTLIDGVIVGNDAYLVYRLPSGQTALYRLTNGVLSPINPSSGGLQSTNTGQVIDIEEVAVHPSGDIFLVGRVPNGQVTIFRRSGTSTVYQPISAGQHIFLISGRDANNFAFSSGSSILILGDNSTRQDNINSPVTTLAVTPDNQLWYISGNQLFHNGQHVVAPVVINSTTRLLFTTGEGLCIFTPGF